MTHRILHMIIVLIALQSSIAVADFYQPHHSEEEHIQTIDTDNSLSNDELKTHQSTTDEINHSCHHYCAPHSTNFIDINDFLNINSITYTANIYNSYLNHFKNRSISPDLRPPII